MIYIAYLKLIANTVIDLHLKELPRSGSVTLLSDDHRCLLDRFNMTPANTVVEDILKEEWSLPFSHKTSYQIRRLTSPTKQLVTLFKQDPRNNRLVIIKTADVHSGHSTGSYLGYSGSPDGFFTMLNDMGIMLSDFETTLLHVLD